MCVDLEHYHDAVRLSWYFLWIAYKAFLELKEVKVLVEPLFSRWLSFDTNVPAKPRIMRTLFKDSSHLDSAQR